MTRLRRYVNSSLSTYQGFKVEVCQLQFVNFTEDLKERNVNSGLSTCVGSHSWDFDGMSLKIRQVFCENNRFNTLY